ncbi:MAG TPA: tail fiber domain-containing protein [Ruminiclostridium sp.]|nr:tail fiber domain-containing protein [Ruminiclostridium sp.]
MAEKLETEALKKRELKRMNYFDGLFLDKDDYKLDQNYQTRLQQLHNRYLHTWGILYGLEVVPDSKNCCAVEVTEGIAINRVQADNGESTSQYIYVTDETPRTIDLSSCDAGQSIYIYVSYDEELTDRNDLEKGNGQYIHIWEKAKFGYSSQKPDSDGEKIVLARVILDGTGGINTVVSNKIFKAEGDGSSLRRYAGPSGSVISLEKIIFRLIEDIQKIGEGGDTADISTANLNGMPFIQAALLTDISDKKVKGLEVNSELTEFTGDVNIAGDLSVNGTLINEGLGQQELEVSNSFVQVNSDSGQDKWELKDGGLEVYRGFLGEKSLDARILWSEGEKCWKMGYEDNLFNVAYGTNWDSLIKNGLVDDLHKHSVINYKDGVALKADENGNLLAGGNLYMSDKTIWLRGAGNPNHGLGWFGNGKLFAGINVDGPVLFGQKGGVLGTTDKEQKPVLSWNNMGNVGIGIANPKDDMLEVAGNVRILSQSNPLRFTSAWTAFPDSSFNCAEISNDTGIYKALMIVGNKSADQGKPISEQKRRVAIWDRLDVNGFLYVNGNMQLTQAITPSAGNSADNGIVFPGNPGGGAGDSAWIRYYPRSGEACTLEIGTSNDGDDNISLMASGNVGIGTLNPGDKLDVSGWTRLLSDSNPIRFTSVWSGFPDLAPNQAEICNDTTNYKTLMIVGNKSGNQGRKVSIWDRLEVNGTLNVNGDFQTTCAIVPSVGNSENNGITFPKDYYGGSGDCAWIRYYSDASRGGGENMTLEIGISNDPGNGGYSGGGDRIKLAASGGVYVDGYFYYSSSRDLKENIKLLSTKKAKQILDGMNPVTFNFRGDTEKTTLGFIAEDVPVHVAANDQKAISPMEIIAVLTSVVKDQRKAIAQLQQKIESLAG